MKLRATSYVERLELPGLGWAAATAIMIFAFVNTVLVGSTLLVSLVMYNALVSLLSVVAPGLAVTFTTFANLLSFL